jgi:hypothetical protein
MPLVWSKTSPQRPDFWAFWLFGAGGFTGKKKQSTPISLHILGQFDADVGVCKNHISP